PMTPAWDIVVLGAGAAGLVAAFRAAELGRRVLLLEKNRKPGVKILMSGGTRCNLTHATDNRGIVDAYGPPGRFLHSALAALAVPVADLKAVADGFEVVTPLRTLTAGRVILTTGGRSYPGCGTVGDGYRIAAAFGHTIVPPRPALVPITTDAAWVADLRGDR